MLAGPIGLTRMQIGLVYFVCVPSILLTPFAGAVATRIGARLTVILAFIATALGLPLLESQALALVLAGLVLVVAGAFFAQAAATGLVSRTCYRNLPASQIVDCGRRQDGNQIVCHHRP